MRLQIFLVLLFSVSTLCSVINNVRLVDHISYAIEVLTRTMNVVEDRGWCNLKLPEITREINENVLSRPMSGTIKYTNGFVTSIQRVDIQQSTVQQVWSHNASANRTTVTVRSTLRMHDVSVGYDVIAELNNKHYRYTTVYVHPLISYAFSMIKDLNTDELEVTVVGSVPRSTRVAAFRPTDDITDILTTTFDPVAITSAGMIAWGPELFEPIAYEVITKEVTFPTICYNCPVT